MGFIDNLLNAIRNKYLNATGAERDLLTLIKDKDITQAQTLMQNRDTEVLQAIQEYNPELHRIMRKADKMRKGQEPYRTEKLPRARQKYINEVELFFLLGNPIRWKKVNNEGSDEAFEAYHMDNFADINRIAKHIINFCKIHDSTFPCVKQNALREQKLNVPSSTTSIGTRISNRR